MHIKRKKDTRVNYFTWGTLKCGFPNHKDHAHILDRFVGNYATAEKYTMIVPFGYFCPNKGCKYVHRIGALADKVEGHEYHITGELYEVRRACLPELDKLENYHEGCPEKSIYIRKEVQIVSANKQHTKTAYTYVIANSAPYVDLLHCDKAEATPTYTMAMAKHREYKACCKKDENHTGDHCELPIPKCDC